MLIYQLKNGKFLSFLLFFRPLRLRKEIFCQHLLPVFHKSLSVKEFLWMLMLLLLLLLLPSLTLVFRFAVEIAGLDDMQDHESVEHCEVSFFDFEN